MEQYDITTIAKGIVRRSTTDVPRSFVMFVLPKAPPPPFDCRDIPTIRIPRID